MRLFRLEVGKIVCIVIGFISICLLFNAMLIFVNDADRYADYVADVSKTAGVNLEQFPLGSLPQSEYRERLTKEITEAKNVFSGYNAGAIAEKYIDELNLTGRIAEDMRGKYSDLQTVIDEKAERGEALTIYFAGSTYGQHKTLFAAVMPALCIEGIIIVLIAVLSSLGYENMNRTEQLVNYSKVGRRIIKIKYTAAIAVGIAAYLLLTAVTLAFYFIAHDYGSVWGSSISSGFNVINDSIMGLRPFATWHSFTVLSYLLAAFGLSLGVLVCFSLAGFIAGTSIRNTYIAFLTIVLAGVFCIAVPMVLPANSYIRFAFMLTPIGLVLQQPLWFTDGSFNVLWQDFEICGAAFSLLVLLVFSVASAMKYRKRDIV